MQAYGCVREGNNYNNKKERRMKKERIAYYY